MKDFWLEIKHVCKQTGARYGILHTPHGDVNKAFFKVNNIADDIPDWLRRNK